MSYQVWMDGSGIGDEVFSTREAAAAWAAQHIGGGAQPNPPADFAAQVLRGACPDVKIVDAAPALIVRRTFSPCGFDAEEDEAHDCVGIDESSLLEYVKCTAEDAQMVGDDVESVEGTGLLPSGLLVREVCTCECHTRKPPPLTLESLTGSDAFTVITDDLSDRAAEALASLLRDGLGGLRVEDIVEVAVDKVRGHLLPDLRYILTGKGDGCETDHIRALRRAWLKQRRAKP